MNILIKTNWSCIVFQKADGEKVETKQKTSDGIDVIATTSRPTSHEIAAADNEVQVTTIYATSALFTFM